MTHNTPSQHQSETSATLARVEQLLPFYAQQTLQGEEHDFVDNWLNKNLAAHPEIREELLWLQATRQQVHTQAYAAVPNLDAGLEALMQRIAQEQSATLKSTQHTAKPSWLVLLRQQGVDFFNKINTLLNLRSPAFAMSVAVVMVIQAGIIASLFMQQPANQMPLSGDSSLSVPSDQHKITIAFRPNATEQDIRQLLVSVNAQLIAGPSALGLYEVAIDKDHASAAIAQLRAATPIVESVQ